MSYYAKVLWPNHLNDPVQFFMGWLEANANNANAAHGNLLLPWERNLFSSLTDSLHLKPF